MSTPRPERDGRGLSLRRGRLWGHQDLVPKKQSFVVSFVCCSQSVPCVSVRVLSQPLGVFPKVPLTVPGVSPQSSVVPSKQSSFMC